MKTNVYQKILQEAGLQSFKRAEDSKKWFREAALKVSKGSISPNSVINQKPGISSVGKKNIWNLILYNYSPKTKNDLPYYDTFPIVFPYKLDKDGFYGYNLHYLPPNIRAVLMDNIYGLNKASKWFDSCIKKYLFTHIRSKIAVIPQSEWDLALFLPLQRFQKQSESSVWSDSIKKVKGNK